MATEKIVGFSHSELRRMMDGAEIEEQDITGNRVIYKLIG